jgi:hypothetical protein
MQFRESYHPGFARMTSAKQPAPSATSKIMVALRLSSRLCLDDIRASLGSFVVLNPKKLTVRGTARLTVDEVSELAIKIAIKILSREADWVAFGDPSLQTQSNNMDFENRINFIVKHWNKQTYHQ